jgi:hypothetical protein
MEKNTRYLDTVLKPIFVSNNLDTNKIKNYPISARDTTKIEYECTCGNFVSRSAGFIKKKPLCDHCIPKKKTGTKSLGVDNFVKLLESKGYKLTPQPGEIYEHTKSLMTVMNIETGEEHKTSYNRFNSGHHKSMKEACKIRRLTTDEVKRRVEEAGFGWVEGTIYTNGTTPFSVFCHCGVNFEVSVDNLHENRVGCPECYRYNKTYTWEYYEDVAEKWGCTITPLEKYKGRDTRCYIICNCGEEIFKSAKCFMDAPRCSYCSRKLRAATNLEKYGAENVFGSEYGKDTVKKWLKSKGVLGNMAIPEIREKAEATCYKNHGVKCVLATAEVREKAVKAHIEKYGVRAFSTEILMKAQKSRFALKTYVFPSGRVEDIMGYEGICLNYLLASGVKEDDIVVGMDKVPKVMYYIEGDPKIHRYYMDIYIKSKDRAIEVKCTYIYHCNQEGNKAKWVETSKLCKGGIDVYVFEKPCLFVARKRLINGEVVKDRFIPDEKHKFAIPLGTIY